MSVINCYKCDKQVDTDYEESFAVTTIEDNFEMICINCYEEENDEL